MQYFWEALNNFTNGQWRGQRTAWVQTPLLGYRDGGGGRVSSTSTWALISFSSVRGPEPLPALCHRPQPSASTDLHLPRQAGVRADGEGRSSRKSLWLAFALRHTHIPLSDTALCPSNFPHLWSFHTPSYETTDALPESSTCSSTLFLPHYARWVP